MNRLTFNRRRMLAMSTVPRYVVLGACLTFVVAVSAQELVSNAQSVTTPATGTTMGRAPVVSGVAISNQSRPGVAPKVGDILLSNYSFNDADGDAQSGTSIQWRRAGSVIPGATASSYTTVAADANQSLVVEVTPKTNAAITDPAEGALVASPSVNVAPVDADFLVLGTTRRTLADADLNCRSANARLPTRGELQQLFVDATRSPAFHPNAGTIDNDDMCYLHGWPLYNHCGGTNSNYWTSTVAPNGPSFRYGIDMKSGAAYPIDDHSANRLQVVCKRI